VYDYIVTGSAGYLGKTLVEFLEQKGYVVLSLDIQTGFDLNQSEVVERIFEENKARNLINLFALNDKVEESGFRSTFLDLDLEDFRRTLEVNVTSLFSVCREFIRNNTQGNIVNFSSIYGVRSPDPRLYGSGEKPISYGVSKAAVLQLSRHLATHAAPDFRVNSIVLGGVFENQHESFIHDYSLKVPLARMGNPEDIQEAVLFLTSESSTYVTGSAVYIDGGFSSW
jgi:NAD(P)-dependent dehydrogenase (short-subunit alcohol dehydrogenase family)